MRAKVRSRSRSKPAATAAITGTAERVTRPSSASAARESSGPQEELRASRLADGPVRHTAAMAADLEAEKRAAAEAAAELVQPGWTVGLGTGSTVAHLLPALAARDLGLTCVATSVATEHTARALGIEVVGFDAIAELDMAIDGADQATPEGWLIKGGGGAHTREKVVAAAAHQFVVIASSDKPVDRLRPPVPLELLGYGLQSTLRALGGEVTLRHIPPSPDGGIIADYHGAVDDPAALAARLDAIPGVVGHGLFDPGLVSEVLVARGEAVTSWLAR
jgi:ribose 5-phosphate isomerase A